MSNFSFFHGVFKRLVQQTHKNQGLFGKGLTWRKSTAKTFEPSQPVLCGQCRLNWVYVFCICNKQCFFSWLYLGLAPLLLLRPCHGGQWRTCVSWLSHTSTNTTLLSKATDYFSHMLLQRWEAKICWKESSPKRGIELTTTRSWVWYAHNWATPAGLQNKLCLLTLYSRDTHFNASTTDSFWKQCGKRRNCLSLAISPFFTLFLLNEITVSFYPHLSIFLSSLSLFADELEEPKVGR